MIAGVPTDAVAQIALLMSGASAVKDDETRAVYTAAARVLLEEQRKRLLQAEAIVGSAEGELVRRARLLRAKPDPGAR